MKVSFIYYKYQYENQEQPYNELSILHIVN